MNNRAAIQSAQLRQLLSVSNVSLLTSITLAAILGYVQRNVVDASELWGWGVLMVLGTLGRVAAIVEFQRHPVYDDEAVVERRLFQFRLGVLFAGLAWGAGSFLLFPSEYPQHQMFLVFMMMGLTAGGVVSFSSDLASALLFVGPVIAGVMLREFTLQEGVSYAMSLAALLYLGFMMLALRRINGHILENIALRIEATEREAALRVNKERYRSLLAHSPVGIFHYDADLMVTYCNERFAGILHSTVERLTGLDMNHLQDGSVLPALKQALAGETGHYEGHYRATFSEADIWIEMTCAPSLDSAGSIVGGVAIVQDITARKQDELELRIAATAFETQEGILIADSENRILRVNRAFTRLTGYSPEEAVGQTPSLLRSGRHDAEFYRAMWQALAQFGYWEGEIWNRRKNGEIFPEALTVTAVRDAMGNVTHYVAVFSDITLRKEAEEQIHQLAFYDPLTRLPNRRLLMDRLHHAIVVGARAGTASALLFIDLDNFKMLNDTKGHDVGDLLLLQAARRLEDCVRDGDTVARLGGDEFIVLLEDLSSESGQAVVQAEAVGEKIREALNEPYRLGNFEFRCTSSIGISLFSDHELSVEELLRRADTAMYQAKTAGRNALRFFDPAMQAALEKRSSLEADLRQALSRQQFRLYYQLQVDADGRAIGAEALLRWVHPERGMVSPLDFIPLAEETGLILPIGLWVVETACAQIAAWQANPAARELQVAVNVSARQFHQPDFVGQVLAAVERSGIPSMLLKIELTESVVLDDIEDTIHKIGELKRHGVRFAMDDFGTGYSSLAYLSQLPLDQLKIDQSFVRNIGLKPTDAVITQAVISLGRNLGMEVIAEGVETEAQRDFLAGQGCHAYQGYLFARPLPAGEFERLLDRDSSGKA